MEYYSGTKKNAVLSFVSNLILHRLRRPKTTFSPSYVDYKPKTTAVILLDMSHTLKGECVWEKQGKGRKLKFECG
jgi:hypothetical protein